jgi:hypothetical protein
MTHLKAHPTIVLGVVCSILLAVNSAATGNITWTVAIPFAVALILHSLVSPAIPGWIARNGVLLGIVGSLAVLAGQLADGTVTLAAAYPIILLTIAKAYDIATPEVNPPA